MNLTKADFADLFGCHTAEVPAAHTASCWEYEPIEGEERDSVILGLMRRIDGKELSIAGVNTSRWDLWKENLDAFKETNRVEALAPRYIRSGRPLRLRGEFIRPKEPAFEANWYALFRDYFTYRLGLADTIFEFGCGSAHNVAYLAKRYPRKKIVGLDWAQPSVDIVDRLAAQGLNVEGRLFDFFDPDYTLDMPPNSAVLTVGALEQTGWRWGPFLVFLLEKKPALCLHIEPIREWYGMGLVDYTAVAAHRARNFWAGFPHALLQLQEQGCVEIIKTKRSYFGSEVLEGYSQILWRPL